MSYLDNYADENFSGFEGDVDVYTGEGDDMLDFAGGTSFADEQRTGRIFVMNITNNTDQVQNAIISPSFATELEGGLILKNGGVTALQRAIGATAASTLTASGSPMPIDYFTAFVKQNPVNLVGMRVSSSVKEQLQQVMTVKEHSPFRQVQSKEYFLSTYISENNYREDIITVPTPDVVLGDETELSLPIMPNAKVTVTLFIGAVLSASSTLRKKVKRATKEISIVGVDNVRRANLLGQ